MPYASTLIDRSAELNRLSRTNPAPRRRPKRHLHRIPTGAPWVPSAVGETSAARPPPSSDRHAPVAVSDPGDRAVRTVGARHPCRPSRRRARSRRRPSPRRHRPGRHRRGTKRARPARLRRPGAPECERHPWRRHYDRRRNRTGRRDPAVLEPAGALGSDRAVGTFHDKRPGTMRPGPRRRDNERGSATVELVILTPLLILLLLFVVALGRLAGARIDVDGVAAQAARAASIARSPQAAMSSRATDRGVGTQLPAHHLRPPGRLGRHHQLRTGWFGGRDRLVRGRPRRSHGSEPASHRDGSQPRRVSH